MRGIATVLGILLLSGTALAGPALPGQDQVLTRIAFSSCAEEENPQPIWQAIGAGKPDIFLFMGDNVYVDRRAGKRLDALSEADFDFAYDTLRANPDFAPFEASVPILATWDDHDYGMNDSGADSPVQAIAKRHFLAQFPNTQDPEMAGRDGIYHAAVFGPEGRRVQVIMLDTRSFRSDLHKNAPEEFAAKGAYSPDADPAKTLLGADQWAWLARQLEVKADVRLLVSSIQVEADGHGWEAWRTLPLEREKLFRLIRDKKANGVLLLSGDRHVGGFYRRDDAVGYPLHEITASSLNAAFVPNAEAERDPYLQNVLYAGENYGTLAIDWAAGELVLSLRDIKGKAVQAARIRIGDLSPKS